MKGKCFKRGYTKVTRRIEMPLLNIDLPHGFLSSVHLVGGWPTHMEVNLYYGIGCNTEVPSMRGTRPVKLITKLTHPNLGELFKPSRVAKVAGAFCLCGTLAYLAYKNREPISRDLDLEELYERTKLSFD